MWYLLIYKETLKIPCANINLRPVAQWAKARFFSIGYISHLMFRVFLCCSVEGRFLYKVTLSVFICKKT